MKAALFGLAGVLVGMLVTFLLVIAVEVLSNVVHPFPENVEMTNEEMCRHVARYPHWVLGVAALAWAATAFAGTWTAHKIGALSSSAIVGALILAALICNVSMLPYPLWFKVVILAAVPLAIVAAVRSFAHPPTLTVSPAK